MIDPSISVLVAQVRHADASHKIDTTHQLLRSHHFNGPSNVVYLGDVAKALLANLPHPETPEFTEAPGYNEQRWALRTVSGDLKISIASRSYWGWGLFTSGYLNVIALEGPVADRARLVLDITSALGQSPWEMARQRPAQRWLNRHHGGTDLNDNELRWKALVEAGRQDLLEAIVAMKIRCTEVLEGKGENIDHATWHDLFEQDLHMAQRALAEDNAPGVDRALARLEADLIQLNNEDDEDIVAAPEEVVSDGSDLMETAHETSTTQFNVVAEHTVDEVPFVDLTAIPSQEEE